MREDELREAQRIVARVLHERVKSVKFDPVLVRPGIDEDGGEILFISAIMDDEDSDNLNIDETVKVIKHIWYSLLDAGTQAFPVTSFESRSEWEAYPDEPE